MRFNSIVWSCCRAITGSYLGNRIVHAHRRDDHRQALSGAGRALCFRGSGSKLRPYCSARTMRPTETRPRNSCHQLGSARDCAGPATRRLARRPRLGPSPRPPSPKRRASDTPQTVDNKCSHGRDARPERNHGAKALVFRDIAFVNV